MKKIFYILVFLLVPEICPAKWESVNNGITDFKPLTAEVSGKRVYVGGWSGLYSTDNFGESWENLNLPINSAARVFGILPIGDSLIISTTLGIFVSFDKGKSWECRNNGLQCYIYNEYDTIALTAASNKNRLYAGTSNGVFISSDFGEKWSALNKGIETELINSFYFKGDTIFAGAKIEDDGSGGGLFISSDAGQNWSLIKFKNYTVKSIIESGGRIYCGISDLGVHYTEDYGKNWVIKNHNLFPLAVTDLRKYDETFLCTTFYGGVFASKDRGENWVKINDGFTEKSLRGVVICGDYLIAAAYWSGMYRHNLNDFLNLVSVDDNEKSGLVLYPNPAENQIRFSDLEELPEYSIMDLTGKICQFGSHSDNSIDISRLPKGVYFINIHKGKNVATKCFIKN